jgi:translation initiation factor IF-3
LNNRYINPNFKSARRYEDPVRAGLVCNEQIRYPEVRLLDAEGNSLGVVNAKAALKMARDQGLDLVEITAEAKPPVVKIVDIGKHVYSLKRARKEQEKKARENATVVKEIQLRPVTDTHDLEIKINHAKEFLADEVKVRIVIKFKGRELSFTDKGFAIMENFLAGLGECRVEKAPTLDGKSILAIVSAMPKNK